MSWALCLFNPRNVAIQMWPLVSCAKEFILGLEISSEICKDGVDSVRSGRPSPLEQAAAARRMESTADRKMPLSVYVIVIHFVFLAKGRYYSGRSEEFWIL